MKSITIISLSLGLVACGSPSASTGQADDAATTGNMTIDPVDAEADRALARANAALNTSGNSQSDASYTPAQLSMICRAGIAAEFGRSHKIMHASTQSDGLIRVTYKRPDDGKLWKSDCKVEGDRIVWRTVDAYGDNGPGRWRTGPDDDVLSFTIKGKAVTTHSSDGSSASETYRF